MLLYVLQSRPFCASLPPLRIHRAATNSPLAVNRSTRQIIPALRCPAETPACSGDTLPGCATCGKRTNQIENCDHDAMSCVYRMYVGGGGTFTTSPSCWVPPLLYIRYIYMFQSFVRCLPLIYGYGSGGTAREPHRLELIVHALKIFHVCFSSGKIVSKDIPVPGSPLSPWMLKKTL